MFLLKSVSDLELQTFAVLENIIKREESKVEQTLIPLANRICEKQTILSNPTCLASCAYTIDWASFLKLDLHFSLSVQS